jgi:hypothetical protein
VYRDFSEKVEREDISARTGNENLHKTSNVICIRLVNFTTTKELIVKRTITPYPKFVNTLEHSLMKRQTDHASVSRRQPNILDALYFGECDVY